MRVVDCHIHLQGDADPRAILATMDRNGVDRILMISPLERKSLDQTRRNLLCAKKLMDAAPDRISGLAWVEPTIPGMADLAEEALGDMGFVGIKIIPDHWFAYEERLQPFWARMNTLSAHILFHTGILYAHEDGSRFCRPLWLEQMMHYPNVRFAMAHISWPWCEECLAVMGRMKHAAKYQVEAWQSYIDLTPGSRGHVARHAIADAIEMYGPDRIMFGTDNVLPGDMSNQKQRVENDLRLFDELGLSEDQKERIMSGTADELFPTSS